MPKLLKIERIKSERLDRKYASSQKSEKSISTFWKIFIGIVLK